jgi:hypothetical protein
MQCGLISALTALWVGVLCAQDTAKLEIRAASSGIAGIRRAC